jgi:hypothetical protein
MTSERSSGAAVNREPRPPFPKQHQNAPGPESKQFMGGETSGG